MMDRSTRVQNASTRDGLSMKVIPGEAREERSFPGSESRIRFNRGNRCPICDGAEDDPRGQGRRCSGFRQGDWIHCSREEHAGRAKFNATSGTYAHRANGPCPCGKEHAPANPSTQSLRGRIDCVYDYRDAHGKVVYQTVRLKNPKDFRQRRPKPGGGYHWNLSGVELILYMLPRLLAQIPRGLSSSSKERKTSIDSGTMDCWLRRIRWGPASGGWSMPVR